MHNLIWIASATVNLGPISVAANFDTFHLPPVFRGTQLFLLQQGNFDHLYRKAVIRWLGGFIEGAMWKSDSAF